MNIYLQECTGDGPDDFDVVEHPIDVPALQADLAKDNFKLVLVSPCGELVIEDLSAPGYVYRREVWQARNEGEGCNNTYWGDLPGGYEFCRSIKLAD